MDLDLDKPLRIASIRIEGANHTRRGFLDWLLRPHTLAAEAQSSSASSSSSWSSPPPTARSVLEITAAVSRTLQDSDLFEYVSSRLDIAGDPYARVPEVDVLFHAKERGRFYMKTATEVGDGEGSASIQARIRNLFGGAERLDAALSMGTKTRRALNVSLSAPLHPSFKTRGEVTVYAAERDLTGFASHVEDDRGVRCSVTDTRSLGVHEVAYELVQRSMAPSAQASLSIREQSNDTIKSSISHTWSLDTRDSRTMGTRGTYVRLAQELAGLGGDAAFYKAQGDLSLSRPVPSSFLPTSTVSLGLRSGILYPLLGRPSLYPDRFQLGGSTSVRVFRMNGLGPKDRLDSLGGDLTWAAGVSLISAIPRRSNWPLKTHLFLNAGGLQRLHTSLPLPSQLHSVLSRPSVAAGVGLVYDFTPLRVELNFGMPLVAHARDGFVRGFQFGVGVEFL